MGQVRDSKREVKQEERRHTDSDRTRKERRRAWKKDRTTARENERPELTLLAPFRLSEGNSKKGERLDTSFRVVFHELHGYDAAKPSVECIEGNQRGGDLD